MFQGEPVLIFQTTLRLANDFSNIIGIKEASGNLEQIMMIISNKPENFWLYQAMML